MRLRVIVATVASVFAASVHGQVGDLAAASTSHAPQVLAATQAPLGVEGSDPGGEAPTPTTPDAGQPQQTEQKVFTLTTLTTTPPADIKSTPVPGFSFPPGTTYETVTVEHTATSGMEPIPTGLQAGTKVTFPGANIWCEYKDMCRRDIPLSVPSVLGVCRHKNMVSGIGANRLGERPLSADRWSPADHFVIHHDNAKGTDRPESLRPPLWLHGWTKSSPPCER